MKWFPEDGLLQLDISDLNFSKKLRGEKVSQNQGHISSKLTRRQCVGKVAEVFDLTGRITPITACMKLDLHELLLGNIDWDDQIPDNIVKRY